MNAKLINNWEKRSLHFKDQLGGVMLSSFPDFVNKIFHNWELSILKDFFPKGEKKALVLDIGCGYGRLALPLAKQFQNSEYYGVDISKEYVRLFNEKLNGKGKAFLGSVDKLPYKSRVFDYVLIVTSLIYMEDNEIKNLVQKVKEITKKNALIVIIENNKSGINYINGFGVFSLIKKVINGRNKFDIDSKAFKEEEIENFFKEDFLLKEKRRCRLLTLLLPLFFLFRKINLKVLSSMTPDINLPFLPTLFTAYIFRVKHYEEKNVPV